MPGFEVRRLPLDGLFEVLPPRFADERGFFSETWNANQMARAGFRLGFVQDNHSYSVARGVLRGLHFQMPPFAQDKLVRVIRGSAFDVAVDIRKGSPTFGQWVGVTLSRDDWNQMLIPRGFAHGFVTLEPDTELAYKVTAPYSPEHDRSIRYDDPQIGIQWPVAGDEIKLSAKDQDAPLLRDIDTAFEFA